jgi:hypothetical protein
MTVTSHKFQELHCHWLQEQVHLRLVRDDPVAVQREPGPIQSTRHSHPNSQENNRFKIQLSASFESFCKLCLGATRNA